MEEQYQVIKSDGSTESIIHTGSYTDCYIYIETLDPELHEYYDIYMKVVDPS